MRVFRCNEMVEEWYDRRSVNGYIWWMLSGLLDGSKFREFERKIEMEKRVLGECYEAF